MKRNKKHINKNLEKFFDYVDGKITGQDRNIFEKDLQKDPFESDAAEGLSALSSKHARQDMSELNNRLFARTNHSNRFIFYRIAAAVAAIIIVGSIIVLLTSDLDQVFQRAAVTENSQVDKEKIEEPLTESQFPATNIQTESENETVPISEQLDAEITLDIAEEENEQTIGGINKKAGAMDDDYIVSADKEPELKEEESAMPVISATKSETSEANSIVTRKYIGMEQSEVSADTAETTLDEVVVIGYGVQKKSNITGVISTIEMDDSPDWQLPSPVIGTRKYKEYIKENLQYPSFDTTDIRAVVVLNFIVAENGRPKNISVLKSPGRSFSDEAIRLLVSGPDWYPSKRDGEIIEAETMIRIVFRHNYE
jgi:hypothetical protein